MKLPIRAAAGFSAILLVGLLLLAWLLKLADPGAWLGLGLWGLLSSGCAFSILKTGRVNPYRLGWFGFLALGTLGAVLSAPLPEVSRVAPSVCPIVLSTTLGGLLAHTGSALMGQGHDVFSYVTGLTFLTLVGLIGTSWCSWVCGYGAWDESVSRLSARRPVWSWRAPSGLWQYVNVGLWGAVALATWMQRETLFCQWICPFKATENVGTPAGVTPLWPMLTLLGIGAGFVFILPLLTGKRTFCRYICPLGAWQSLWSRWHPWQREWRAAECRHCAACEAVCPMQAIRQEQGTITIDRMCNHCGRCEDHCPEGALALKWAWQSQAAPQAARRWTRVGFVSSMGLVAGTLGAGAWIQFGYNVWHVFVNKG